MFKIKQIIIGTYENFYKRNIQLQFLNDTKFVDFMQQLCDVGSDYQSVLKQYSEQFNLGTQQENPNVSILNAIGGLLGLPSIEYFFDTIDDTTMGYYILLIKGQQLKNTWDGTNEGILSTLRTLFPEYIWEIADFGTMSINVYLGGANIDATVEQLFLDGWFTPKAAGVGISCSLLPDNIFTWDSDNIDKAWDNGKWL